MPKNLFQEIVFSVIMVFVMVYAMICYNLAWNMGGLTNEVFVEAFSEMWEALIALVIELIIVGPIARKLTFRIIDPAKHAPIIVTWTMSGITVAFMCPIMSFVATLIFNSSAESGIFATWILTVARNFPMALCWQIFFAGPLVRLIFRAIFVYPKQHKEKKLKKAAAAAGEEVAADDMPVEGAPVVESVEIEEVAADNAVNDTADENK